MRALHKTLIATWVVIIFTGVFISPVSAQMYQSQSQSFSSSASTSSDGNNSGWHESRTSVEVSQQQTQRMGGDSQGQSGGRADKKSPTHKLPKNNKHNKQNKMTAGKVNINWQDWDWNGGTCYVQYTEANSNTYRYNTSTACDNDEITIGGLVPGTSYRFQIKKDNGTWSAPFTAQVR